MSLDPSNRARIVSDIDQYIAGSLDDDGLHDAMAALAEATARAWGACEGMPAHMKGSYLGSQFAHTLALLARDDV